MSLNYAEIREQYSAFLDDFIRMTDEGLAENEIDCILDDKYPTLKKTLEKCGAFELSVLPEKWQSRLWARSDRITIRALQESDREFFLDVHRQWENKEEMPTEEEKNSTWDYYFNFKALLFCLIEEYGRPVGLIGVNYLSSMELGVCLDSAARHRGIGSEAITLFTQQMCRLTGRTKFPVRTMSDNIASQHCLEKLGAYRVPCPIEYCLDISRDVPVKPAGLSKGSGDFQIS